MNAARRLKIAALLAKLDEVANEVADVYEEEQEYFDNMPESFQNGDKGGTVQEALDALETAQNAVTEAIDGLTQAEA